MTSPPKIALQRQDYLLLGIAGLLMLIWNVLSWQFPFFWDTVLNSKTATWYLDSGFAQLTVPENLDAGHPPFFSFYLAGIWAAFGRSLAVAHLAMLPWLFLLLVQYHRLTLRWLSPKGRIWAMALLFCEPTFLAQSSMVTPDIALVACYLLALNALLDGRRWLLALSMIAMASMSFRGILMLGTVFVTDMALAWIDGRRRPDLKKAWPYIPVAALVAVWLWLHHQAVGWLLSPPEQTYGGQRQVLGLAGMARNAALVGWRLMDFGRIFLWDFVFLGIVFLGWKKLARERKLKQNLIAMLALVGGLALLFIPFSNPPGHRYFLVGYLLLLLLVVGLAELGEWKLRWKAALWVVMIGLASGHLWIYPRGVAQGWDATLAHLPIFDLQERARLYLRDEGISADDVCADFPLLHEPSATSLLPERDSAWYRNFLEESDCKWALVSNMNNGFTDAQLAHFDNPGKWELKQEFRSFRLFIRLYKHL